MRKIIGYSLAFLALGPLIPLYFLSIAFQWLSDVIDNFADLICGPFLRLSGWVESKFHIGADDEYEAWKQRMREAGKF